MISLIMPFYNRYDLVHKRLYELWMYVKERENFEILLINDASPEEKDYEGNIAWWQKQVDNPHKIRYHRNEKNLGFGGSMNLGAKHANGDILIFFSDDVTISGDFVTQLVTKTEENKRSLIGNEIIDFPSGWNEFTVEDKSVYIPYLNGWFLSATAVSWEESGGFDPQYYPFDFEDVDISTRYVEMGYNLVALNSKFLYHLGGATILSQGFNRSKYTREHQDLYYKKWKDRLLEIHHKLQEQGYVSRPYR